MPFVIFLLPEAYVIALVAFLSSSRFSSADAMASGRFAVEGVAVALAVMFLLRTGRRWGRAGAAALAVAFVGVVAIQFISFRYTFDFLPRLAFENTDNIRLFFTWYTLVVIVTAAVYASGVVWWVWKFVPERKSRLHFLAGVVVLPLSFVVIGPTATEFSADVLQNVPRDPPMISMTRTLLRLPGSVEGVSITLSRPDLADMLPETSGSAFPLVKDRVYESRGGLMPDGGAPPNVIVIFAEGVSSRLVNAYDETFPGLTEEISTFALDERSLVVNDYYSHTAATFHGLLGQLCSIYPADVAHSAWRDAYRVRLLCLSDIFREAGYSSEFFDPHFRDMDYLHDMLGQLGFDEVLTAEDIVARHLGGSGAVRLDVPFVEKTVALTNGDTLAAVADAAERWRRDDPPHLLATYLFGTHAWLDTPEDGVKYGDGRNNSLNTVRDLDEAFGEFWRRFRASDAYGRTVVIFTSDHARYHETSYVQALAERGVTDYKRLFSDRIPLVIHDPRGVFERTWDARSATSIDFAPTVAHYLGLPNEPNPFLGKSLFERGGDFGLVNFGDTFYLTAAAGVFDVSLRGGDSLEELRGRVRGIHELMDQDRVWPKDRGE